MEFLGVRPSIALGSDRSTKDVDCFVAAEKEDIGSMFLGKPGWNRIPGQRQDYIAFLVGERTENVLVEFFPGKFRFGSTITD